MLIYQRVNDNWIIAGFLNYPRIVLLNYPTEKSHSKIPTRNGKRLQKKEMERSTIL